MPNSPTMSKSSEGLLYDPRDALAALLKDYFHRTALDSNYDDPTQMYGQEEKQQPNRSAKKRVRTGSIGAQTDNHAPWLKKLEALRTVYDLTVDSASKEALQFIMKAYAKRLEDMQ